MKSFDREMNDSFILDVQAEDGALSSLPGAQGPNRGIFIFLIFLMCSYINYGYTFSFSYNQSSNFGWRY